MNSETRMNRARTWRRVLTRVSSIAALGVLAGGVHAQTDDVARAERHRVPADFMSYRGAQWLERTERLVEEQPDRVLEVMALRPGDVVADIGCGSGYYARRIAPRVAPEGRVYCVDIQPEMLDIMRDLAGREGVEGIEAVLSAPDDLRLPDGQIDWIILADVYHEMSDYEAMLAGMKASLAPGGRVALLEYRIEDGTGDNLKADHAMSVRQVLSEWRPAGFALVDLFEFLPGQHLFILGVEGDTAGGENPIVDLDLFDAVERGLVQAVATGANETHVAMRIRNLSDDRLVVTMPVAVSFLAVAGCRDMVSRRDAAIRLFDDEWQEWRVRSVGRQVDRPVSSTQPLAIERSGASGPLEALMYVMQVGTYRVGNSPLLYVPRVHGIEQVAVWIAEQNLSYDELAAAINDERMPDQYAMAFALVYYDLAGLDVTTRRVWEDRERVFGRLRDPGLNAWYGEKGE